MTMVRRCNCDYEKCKTARNIRNVHVGEECIHASGISHIISKIVIVN